MRPFSRDHFGEKSFLCGPFGNKEVRARRLFRLPSSTGLETKKKLTLVYFISEHIGANAYV